jgi:flagellar M-ring protein FliF
VGGFLESLQALGRPKLFMLAAATVIILGMIGFLASGAFGTRMSTLYTKLDTKDVTAIAAQLEALQIPYQLADGGTTIQLPSQDVGRARVRLAELGLPREGSLGYELFDKNDSLGTSTFQQNVTKVRALEGEIGRTLGSIDGVRAARVHLVLPERELFSRERQQARASVFLTLQGSKQLGAIQIAAIRHLVASAVPQLDVQNISIVDDRGNLIAKGGSGEGDESFIAENNEQMRLAFESKMRTNIEDMVGNIVGLGKVRAQVSTEMDFNKVTKDSEVYDPESKVERSTQNVAENETEHEKSESVSVANNLPDKQASQSPGSNTVRNQQRTEETVNYEISRTVTKEIRQVGQVKRLSVAVLVDGTYTMGEDGKKIYTPLPQEQLDRFDALVKSAIGFDANRGDTVEIVNMQFLDTSPPMVADNIWLLLSAQEYVRIGQTLVLAVIGLLMILLVVRPMVQRLTASAPEVVGGPEAEALLGSSGLTPALEAPDGSTLPANQQRSAVEEMLDMDYISGQIRASSVKRIGDLIEKYPDESLQIIRNWMQQGVS